MLNRAKDDGPSNLSSVAGELASGRSDGAAPFGELRGARSGERLAQDGQIAIVLAQLSEPRDGAPPPLDEQVELLLARPDLLQASLASLGVGAISLDAEGRVRWLSPLVEELADRLQGEVIGASIDLLFQACAPPARRGSPATSGDNTETNRVRSKPSGPDVQTGLLLTRSGTSRSVRHAAVPVHDAGGAQTGTVILLLDVTEARLNALRLEHYSTRDPLTGFLNRQELVQQVSRLLVTVDRENVPFSLVHMDLDQFKLVNRTCGYDGGDRMLQWVAAMIRETLRENDFAARIGRDEFVMLFEGTSSDHARKAVDSLQRQLGEFRFSWGDKTFSIVASFGIAFPAGFESAEALLSAAEHACVAAKECSGDHVQVYQRGDAATARRHGAVNWVASIKKNLQHNGVCLFGQPIRALCTDSPRINFEVLFRMVDENGLIRGPDGIIETAEQYGLISVIDRWVLRHTLRLLSAQPQAFLDGLDHCSVNLSGASLKDPSLVDFIRRQFDRVGIPPGKICFEITETSAVRDIAQARRLMEELGTLGCRFALDDFGSGMASYAYLRDLPVNYVKIDGSFVRGLASSTLDRAIVGSITQIGHMLGIGVVAEGVETQAIDDQLKLLGVDLAQGYLYGRPRLLTDLCAAEVSRCTSGRNLDAAPRPQHEEGVIPPTRPRTG
jgi:diguanylate cyclase (GGDEF)-like protein